MFRCASSLRSIGSRSGTRCLSVTATQLKSNSSNGRNILIASSIISGAGVTLYWTNDSFHQTTKHSFLTLKRVGVVTVAATKCFYLYGKTLHLKEYDTEDARNQELSKTHLQAAKITLKALEKNGGIYIKLGQHVSAMTYLLPREWTDTMIPLQQRCPESEYEEIDEMFKSDLGKSIDEMFVEFKKEPIGVASLAQVHVGRMRETGEQVAIKCQHPSLKEFVPIDVLMTQNVFKWMLEIFPEYPLTWLGDELRSSIYVELDFNNELKNAINTENYFKKFIKKTALRIPKIVESHKRILIMEFVNGERLDNLQYLDDHNISRSQVSSCLSHIFNNMIFTPNVGVHCDPHGGNLLIRSTKPTSTNPNNFEIILYDHGLYRQIPEQMRIDYAKFWLSLLDKNLDEMEVHAKNFAGVTHEQFPILAAAITGRDFKHALGGDITTERDEKEIGNMHELLLNGGQLLDLMSLLASLPRVVLLILKTNDLTRHLDESLQNPLGLERTFFILASYCANTVLIDELSKNKAKAKMTRWFANLKAYWSYYKRVDELFLYDFILSIKNFINRVQIL